MAIEDQMNKMIDGYWTYASYIDYLQSTRALILDKIIKLERVGKISSNISQEIVSDATKWFIQNHSGLLPSTCNIVHDLD